jgi:hypothetical protein
MSTARLSSALRFASKRRLALLGLIAATLAAQPARALHKESAGAVRLTSGAQHVHAGTRSWDRYFAFSSDVDLLGNGSIGRQIFVFNLLDYDCEKATTKPTTECPNPPQPYLTQVTNGSGSPDNPSVAKDGSGVVWIAFDAMGSFNGGTGAQAGHRQIFTKNLSTGEVLRVTSAVNGDSIRPSLNSGAGTIVFESTAPLTGLVSVAGVSQIFAYVRPFNAMVQLTDGRGPSTHPMANIEGSQIAFESTARLLGDKQDTGVSQIFVSLLNKNTFVATLSQITNGNAPSHHPYLSEKDNVVAFDSTATNFPGTPNGPGSKIYLAQTKVGNFPLLEQFTSFNIHGDCTFPALDPFAQHFVMLCTGDPLLNHTTGNRLFVLNRDPDETHDPARVLLRQLTGKGDIQGPVGANLGSWFATFSSNNDLSGANVCGHQLHVIDYYVGKWSSATQQGQMPPDVYLAPQSSELGSHVFEFLPGASGSGSQAKVTTATGSTSIDLFDGQLGVRIGAPDDFGNAEINIPSYGVILPPIPVDGVGAICLSARADGAGVIDCDGGGIGGDVQVSQDHDTDGNDPLCQAGCRENDPTCQGGIVGPHNRACPVCSGGLCSSGPNAGMACSADATCQPDPSACVNGQIGVCNGPTTTQPTGTFTPGGMQLTLPLALALSPDPGPDGLFCTSDDHQTVSNIPLSLRLTTGTETVSVVDRNLTSGQSISASDSGAPFECTRLRSGDLAGARLVGGFEHLDVPGIGDVVLTLRLESQSLPFPDGDCSAAPCTHDSDCNDGNLCNGVESCVAERCVPGTPIVCDDGNACNGLETCDASSGECGPGTPPTCNDNNPCTNDSCVPSTGCIHTNNTNPCSDSNLCTTGDTCQNGLCQGTPIICSNGNACDGAESCDPQTGQCVNGTPPNCDDSNTCTDDFCNAVTGCGHVATAPKPCDDHSLCTVNDTCQNGSCVGTALPCGDNDPCNGTETCDPETGICHAGTPPDCDDHDLCTDDSCGPQGCVHTPRVCGDGNACNGTETCDSATGQCVAGTPIICNDGDACNGIETCLPSSGQCQSGTPLPDNSPCDDSNVCTSGDTCHAHHCTGVFNTNPCNDQNACTAGDTCHSGVCIGTAVSCNDGNVCTDDTCNPQTGCTYTPNTAPCSDSNACTTGDVCHAGVCGGAEASCDDGDTCTDDTCDASSGRCINTPVGNFLVCRIQQIDQTLMTMARQIHGAPNSTFGGRVRRQHLEQLVKRARAKLHTASGAPRAKMRRNLVLAERRLKVFIAALTRGQTNGVIDRTIAAQLQDLAAGAASRLFEVRSRA